MAKGMMSRPPTGGGLKEKSARQELRKQYLERRGREYKGGGRVSAMPVSEESGEMTARQQRRQQFLKRKQAREDRKVADYRAQQQAQQAEQQMPPGTFRSDNPQDPNLYTRMPDGRIVGTYMAYPGQGLPIDPGFSLGELPQRPNMSLDNTFIGKMGELPPGTSLADYANAISSGFQQEPGRTPTPEYVNAMPGQLKTGTFTPQGMYRPLPWYATPQQTRERQAMIQGGHYFNQLPPKQRMG